MSRSPLPWRERVRVRGKSEPAGERNSNNIPFHLAGEGTVDIEYTPSPKRGEGKFSPGSLLRGIIRIERSDT